MKTGRCRRWMPWNSSMVNSKVRLYNPISKPTLDHLRSGFLIFRTYFGPPPKWLSDFQNLLWTTSEVAFRFPKPTLDHLRSDFPISKPTSDHLRSDFPISKTYFGPPPKCLSNFKTYFGPPPMWLSDFQNLLRTTSEVTFQFQKLLRVICINSIFYTFELINFILLRSWNPW